MYGDLDTQKDFWKKVQTDRVSDDTIITKRPCFLFAADLVADSGGAGTAYLRDGEHTSADIIIDLSAPTSDKDTRRWIVPVYFKKGLYVDVVSHVTSVVVQYLIAKEQDG